MSFARILQQFHHGEMSRPELDAAVDELLTDTPQDLNAMVADMEQVSRALQVDPEIVRHVRRRITTITGHRIESPDDGRTRLSNVRTGAIEQSSKAGAEEFGGTSEVIPMRTLQPGDTLGGRFRLERSIGRGGMSQVYLAEDQAAYGNPLVAVKVLSESFSSHPDALITLKRETAKAQQLAHPNIVNVRDFGIDGPYVYMWMEYLDGGSLHDELARNGGRGLKPTDAYSILKGACAALDYAHQHRIVHADLKPDNFMLTRHADTGVLQAKVIDFGIARPARDVNKDAGDRTIYDPGKLQALTLPYASPEMLEGKDPDPRDDVYALGCIAYEVYTGKHPFDRISAEYAMARQLTVNAHPALNNQQLSAIRRALAFERNQRTASAKQFLEEFSHRKQTLSRTTLTRIAWSAATVLAALGAWSLYIYFDPFHVDPYAPGTTFKDCPACPSMVVIPSGRFRQGTQQGQSGFFSNERPIRMVSLANPFAVSTTEVTVAEYRVFAEAESRESGPCMTYARGGWVDRPDRSWMDPGFDQTDNHPVTCVSWNDANAYAEWLTQQSGIPYRLPSASEWEYAASAVHTIKANENYSSSSICTIANVADESASERFPAWKSSDCNDGVVFTAPVSSFDVNEFGLYDTLGNVFEWVLDCWNASYNDAPTDGTAWLRGDCSERELRGGSWFTQPDLVYFAFRNRLPSNTRTSSVGFRVVREVPSPEFGSQ